MITDREEIASVLQIGEKILLDHPELYNMSLYDVLVKLDDGTDAGNYRKQNQFPPPQIKFGGYD